MSRSHVFSSEVANALWKYIQGRVIPLETAIARYEEAVSLVDDFTPDAELVTEALAEAARRGHPIYDLLHGILARRHGCVVLTLDKRLKALAASALEECVNFIAKSRKVT